MPSEPESAPQGIKPTSIESGEAFGFASITVRDYLASQHLWTARRAAWLCRKRQNERGVTNDLDRHRFADATTAVLSSVAFLEAFINAPWQDAADDHKSFFIEGISGSALSTMRELWGVERKLSVLNKFQLALVCTGHEPMPTGAEPFDSVDVLITLRNALVHFKPASHASDSDLKMVRRLKSKITPRIEYPAHIQPWFPNKALGAGTAAWACDTAVAFARDWHSRMEMPTDFDTFYVAPDPFDG